MEIDDFAAMSFRRAIEHRSDKASPFDMEYFLIALAGEAGEIMNLLKKYKRGDYSDDQGLFVPRDMYKIAETWA